MASVVFLPSELSGFRKALDAAEVPEKAYALLADRDERLCLTHNHPYWAMFYSERGEHSREQHFETEAEACGAFLASLLADQSKGIRY